MSWGDFFPGGVVQGDFVLIPAEKCFEIWGILNMVPVKSVGAPVKSVEPENNSFGINHIIRCRSTLLLLRFKKTVLALIL